MQNKTIFAVTVIALFIVSAVAGYYGPGWLEARRERQLKEAFLPPGVPKRIVANFSHEFENVEATTEPKYLPDTVLTGLNNESVRIKDFAGKPTLVNLWATWCTPCVVELPSLQKLADHYKGRLNVVPVDMEPEKTPAQITDFLEKRLLGEMPAYIDNSGEFAKNLGVRGIPTSFLIGSDGLILYRFEGDADWIGENSKAFFDIFLLQNR